jgi:adenosylcobinamide kinase/adenosylcobinamide-phosphate guanylyltransferase
MKKIKKYLITGGCRSGKSSYAENLSEQFENPFYIATAAAYDNEMVERITKHKNRRGGKWQTIEEQLDIVSAISQAQDAGADFILLDCITLWLTNLMLNPEIDEEVIIKRFLDYLPNVNVPIALVTNEVGWGIVPDNKLARQFRDLAGITNQQIAEIVDEVLLLVSGIPVKVK